MNYELYYHDLDFVYTVEEDVRDIFKYEFKKKFGLEYDCFRESFDDRYKVFIKDFEKQCNSGNIHYYDYYTTHNFDFLDWLKDNYEDEAAQALYEMEDEEDFDEWWYSLDEDDKKEIYDRWR